MESKIKSSDLIHILDRQTDEILETLSPRNMEYWEAFRKDSLNNENIFDFRANAKSPKSSLLEKRNRLLIQDEDGNFREYVIFYAEQYRDKTEKIVRSNESFTDLGKAKVIEPQILTGATPSTAVQLALDGTEWQPGVIEYTGTQSITIDKHTNPLSVLKLIASSFELEISYRIEIYGNKITGRFVDMRKQKAGYEGKEIVQGKDLTSLRRKEDGIPIVTALLVVGPANADGSQLTVLVEDKEALQRWGRKGQHLIEPYEPQVSDVNIDINTLKTLGETELKKRVDAIVTYEGTAESIEHVFGREHEKIRIGQTVRIKDTSYNPPLYLEARIQELERNQATKRIESFKIGNFIEYRKEELEKQISLLKQLMTQKASIVYTNNKAQEAVQTAAGYTEDYSEKKKVLSETAPTDTNVIWIKPDPEKQVNIAYAHDDTEWVPLTTTKISDTEGDMPLDRVRTGTLILGGPDNGNGRFMLLNENGETIADLDAAGNGGFADLNIGNVKSPSIINVNTKILNFYVDPINGNDNNTGESFTFALKTIQAALERCPKYNMGTINIYLHYENSRNMYEQISISGFIGSGNIIIDAQTTLNILTGDISVYGSSNYVSIRNMTINSVNGKGIETVRSHYVYAENVLVYGQNGGRCFYAENGAKLHLKNCKGFDAAIIIYARTMGEILIENCAGYGTVRGIAAQSGGVLKLAGTHPGGATSNTYYDSGGSSVGTGTVDTAGKGTVPPVQQTKQISTTSGDNWSDLYANWQGDGVRQGNYGYGNRRGLWFFGTSILDTIGSGKTIKAMRVWIQRANESGISGPVRHSLRSHGYAAKPAGQPSLSNEIGYTYLERNKGNWINVDPAFWSFFASGSSKGFGIYTADGSNYSQCTTECWVEITYQ